MVGQRRELVGQPPGLVAEQPRDRLVEQSGALRLEQVGVSRSVSGKYDEAGVLGTSYAVGRVVQPPRRAGARGCRRSPERSCRCRGRRCFRRGRRRLPPRRRPCGSPCRRCRDRVRRRRSRAWASRSSVVEERAPASVSKPLSSTASRSTSRNRQTATIPCGVTAPLSEAIASSFTGNQGTPASSTALRRAAYCSLAASVANTSTTPAGTCIASVSALAPSARKSRCSARTDRRVSLRAAFTRPLRGVRGSKVTGRPPELPDRRQAEAGALTSSGRLVLAVSTSAAKAGASLTARSARILRSTSTPAALRPWMKRL